MREAYVADQRVGREAAADPRVWTVEAVRGLGLTTNVETASSILGISRTTAYALAKRGTFPVRLIRIGCRYLVPTAALLDLLVGEQSHRRSGGDQEAEPSPTTQVSLFPRRPGGLVPTGKHVIDDEGNHARHR